jgi:hypothetical protein
LWVQLNLHPRPLFASFTTARGAVRFTNGVACTTPPCRLVYQQMLIACRFLSGYGEPQGFSEFDCLAAYPIAQPRRLLSPAIMQGRRYYRALLPAQRSTPRGRYSVCRLAHDVTITRYLAIAPDVRRDSISSVHAVSLTFRSSVEGHATIPQLLARRLSHVAHLDECTTPLCSLTVVDSGFLPFTSGMTPSGLHSRTSEFELCCLCHLPCELRDGLP